MAEFENKVAIITGASSGIGQTASVLFAKKGAKVAIVGRNKENLAVTEKECIAASNADNVLSINADLTKLEDLKRIVQETVQKFGKIDILVNNAGAGNSESLLTATFDGYDQMMNLNARAPFFLIQHCTPYLEETKGNVVNVSSVAALRGGAALTAYAMAKAALEQLTRSACAELGAKGIRVNTVTPGLVDTHFADASGRRHLFPIVAKQYCENVPARRFGQSEDIAECILFLASNKKAGFVDGVSLVADGGRTNTL